MLLFHWRQEMPRGGSGSPAGGSPLQSACPFPAKSRCQLPWCLPTATKAADQTTVLTHHHQFCRFH